MARGILIVGFDFSGAHADEFHDWYDLEHLPERERIDGFDVCERWLDVAGPASSLATYDLRDPAVLEGAAYRAIAGENLSPWSKRVVAMCRRLIRFEGEQITPGDRPLPAGAGALLLNAMNIAPEHEAEFNRWYDEEHLPALAAVPGTLAATRYRARAGTHRYAALYHLAVPNVVLSQAWRDAITTPWSDRIRPLFQDRLRILARAYQRAT